MDAAALDRASEDDRARFVAAVRTAAEQESRWVPPGPDDRPTISEAELAEVAGAGASLPYPVVELLRTERWGWTSAVDEGGIRFTLGPEVRRYRGVTDVADYRARQAAPPAVPRRIVVSRRTAAGAVAERLADHLGAHFGAADVLVDGRVVDGAVVAEGRDRWAAVHDAIARCDLLLVVIDRSWLGPVGRWRLSRPDDPVRFAITTALGRGLQVVPVLVDGARFRDRERRPLLAALARLRPAEIDQARLAADAHDLIAAIDRPAPPADVVDVPEPPRRGRLGVLEAAALVLVVVLAVVGLPRLVPDTPAPPPPAAGPPAAGLLDLRFGETAPLADGARPVGIAAGPDGTAWFTEPGTDRIGHVTLAREVSEFGAVAGAEPVRHPFAIMAAPDGGAWFTEGVPNGEPGTSGNRLGRIAPDGTITVHAIPTPDAGAVGIATGPDGTVWFTEQRRGRIGRLGPGGDVVEIAAPVAHPDRIAVGRDGLVWVTDVDADRVASVDATGRAGPAFDVGPVGAGPVDVLPIAGGIWFTTIKGANPDPRGAPAHRIGRLDPASGTLTWTEVPGFAELGPTSLADDPWRDGIWFTDIGDRRVSYIALDSPAVVGQSWGFEPGSAPAGIDVGRDRTVWVADQGANRIRWLTGL